VNSVPYRLLFVVFFSYVIMCVLSVVLIVAFIIYRVDVMICFDDFPVFLQRKRSEFRCKILVIMC